MPLAASCCQVRQGYGLTETCSAGTLGAFDDNGWSCGRVLSSVRVKLVDWDEGGYRNSDKDDPAIGMPRGEARSCDRDVKSRP